MDFFIWALVIIWTLIFIGYLIDTCEMDKRTPRNVRQVTAKEMNQAYNERYRSARTHLDKVNRLR